MKIVEGESRAKFVRKVVGLLAGMALGAGSAFAGNIGSGGDISYVDDGSGPVVYFQ